MKLELKNYYRAKADEAEQYAAKRFVLLVREGVQLPSNLQGLYEVRYSGEKLDSDVTIKLLEAIQDIKKHPLPN